MSRHYCVTCICCCCTAAASAFDAASGSDCLLLLLVFLLFLLLLLSPHLLLLSPHLLCRCRFDEVKAKVYERLLRKLLTKPSRPAVVLLQLMPKGMAYEAGRCVDGVWLLRIGRSQGRLKCWQCAGAPWHMKPAGAWMGSGYLDIGRSQGRLEQPHRGRSGARQMQPPALVQAWVWEVVLLCVWKGTPW